MSERFEPASGVVKAGLAGEVDRLAAADRLEGERHTRRRVGHFEKRNGH
jgi:hypothetical protein